jgi:hypothetical protein
MILNLFGNKAMNTKFKSAAAIIVFGVFAGFGQPAVAATDAELMQQGMWHDPATGLIWSRCSLGQSWNGKTCIGTAHKYNWKDTNAATKQSQLGGFHDWHLPSIADLYSLLRCANGFHNTAAMPTNLGQVKQVPTDCNVNRTPSGQPTDTPLINYDQHVFPNSPASDLSYWSSTANLDFPRGSPLAWIMDFENGNPTYGYKELNMQFIRPVRNGR